MRISDWSSDVCSSDLLSNFVRLVFGAFGTSITTTMWENRAGLHHAQLTEAARPGEPAFDAIMSGMQQNGYSHEQSASIINQLINQKAFTMSAKIGRAHV